jgi:hypothetical protein
MNIVAIKAFRLELDIAAHLHMLHREAELMPSKLAVGDAKWLRQIVLSRVRELAKTLEEMVELLDGKGGDADGEKRKAD